MNASRRLVILGLDSLGPKLTRDLAESDVMPFIRELMQKGSFGTLNSVTPSNTGAGWNSAWTGLPPTKHGFFGFFHYDFKDDIIRISTSDRLKVPPLWQMLNMHGLKTLVINSPMQFPATKLDGIMVSGFTTPSIKTPCAYPPAFHKRLAHEMPDYIFDVPWDRHKTDDKTFERNVDSVIKVFHQRVKVAKLAARSGNWHVLIVVFKSIDNMLHFTWDYVAGNCPDRKRHELTLKAFRELDGCCRELALLTGYPDANVLVFSDHGHGPVKGHLFINRMLVQHGFLMPQANLTRVLNKHITSLRKWFKIGRLQKKSTMNIGTRLKINWPKSKAVMISQGIIYMNVKGRQPQGVVPQTEYEQVQKNITDCLRDLKDENTGLPLIEDINCPCEATANPVPLSEAAIPDIVFSPAEGVVLRTSGFSSTSDKIGSPVWQPERIDNLQGTHTVEGIVLGAGPAFARGVSVEGNLYDIAPTVMAACNLPIPQGLVGRPIFGLLSDDIEVRYDAEKRDSRQDHVPLDSTGSPQASQAYNADEEQAIRDRLTGLGYID